MGLLRICSLCATGLLAIARVIPSEAAAQFDTDIDLRAVASDGERSYLDGGLGELRFDRNHQGVQVGELNFAFRDDFFDIVHVNVNAVSYGDNRQDPLDLTEAYLEIRPFPHTPWRSRLKLGAFYAPISLENRLVGWRSAYSISPSAINSWVGEELRTIGAEYELDWLGRQSGHDWQLGAVGALYGWNDPAGVLMADRGWAIDDRQTTLFGQIGKPGAGGVSALHPFATDVDHRAGYYVGGNAVYRSTLELRALHYDNLADPTARTSKPIFAWHTRFDSAGASWTPSPQWTVISQWLSGDTFVGPAPDAWTFRAAFLLTSWQRGPDQISARYDDFQMLRTHTSFGIKNSDYGHAWTLAYTRQFNAMWSVVLEALQIDSRLAGRALLSEPPGAVERELQLSVRLDL